MANRRMVSLKVVDTDLFLEMPVTARLLYYDLLVRADDDGFVGSPKKIQRMIRCSDDDFKLLMAKRFIIPFESGVCVIRHWKIHNCIRSDRYSETIYKEEKSMLKLEESGVYALDNKPKNAIPDVIPSDIPDGYQMDTQVRLGKDRLGKDRLELGKDRLDNRISWKEILDTWNQLPQPIKSIRAITDKRKAKIKARTNSLKLKQEDIVQAITNIAQSNFLQGKNKRKWVIEFDWLFKDDNNFTKVLEDKYKDKDKKTNCNTDYNANVRAGLDLIKKYEDENNGGEPIW